jgi:hypothetical protein
MRTPGSASVPTIVKRVAHIARPVVNPGGGLPPGKAQAILPNRWIRALRAYPVGVEPGPHGPVVIVAMANPNDLAALDDIAFATGLRVRARAATRDEVDRIIAAGVESGAGSAGQ